MDGSLWGVLLIMLGTGVLGGTASYLSTKPDELSRSSWLTHSILGITAAGIMPLFLSTISSNLLTDIFKNGNNSANFLTFSGFCLLAAFSSRTFIPNFSNQVLEGKVEKNAKDLKGVEDKVDEIGPPGALRAIVDEKTEDEADQYAQPLSAKIKITNRHVDILKALDSSPKYKLRTISGISGELKKVSVDAGTRDELRSELRKLEAEGLAVEIKAQKGMRWATTASGTTIASSNSGDFDPSDLDKDPVV